MASQTLYDKLWQDHLVKTRDDGTALIYIDRQLLHEVTSPDDLANAINQTVFKL